MKNEIPSELIFPKKKTRNTREKKEARLDFIFFINERKMVRSTLKNRHGGVGKIGKPKEFSHTRIFSNSASVLCRISSIIKPEISRTSSFFHSFGSGRHLFRLLITILSFFHMTEAYTIVSMNEVCNHSRTESLRVSPEAAITLLLDASNSIHSSCRVELVAPETHSISLLFVRRKKTLGEKKTAATKGEANKEANREAKCPLVVSFPVLRPEEVKMCLDLCSEEAFKSVEPYTDLLPPRVTLEWIPNVKNSDEILASEIVIAAVGRGRDICSQPNQFSCKSIGYPVYCISKKLVCDGNRNCPFEGRDEEKEMCALRDTYDKVGFGLADTSHIGRGWEFLASEFLKKLTSKEGLVKKTDLSASTEKSTILWSDDGSVRSSESESLPDVLKHYGPWGYLMLGMLICGTVLMFCGLWECCCRRPKAIVSNAVGPALLIINQGNQQNEMEIPSTPEPPRYDDLDQPPSYSTLFPPSKPTGGNATNPLPLSLPIVNSLSNLLINNPSQINSSSSLQNRGSIMERERNNSSPPSAVFTIEVQNSNNVDISREMSDHEARPK